jgi:hypothetical protein
MRNRRLTTLGEQNQPVPFTCYCPFYLQLILALTPSRAASRSLAGEGQTRGGLPNERSRKELCQPITRVQLPFASS